MATVWNILRYFLCYSSRSVFILYHNCIVFTAWCVFFQVLSRFLHSFCIKSLFVWLRLTFTKMLLIAPKPRANKMLMKLADTNTSVWVASPIPHLSRYHFALFDKQSYLLSVLAGWLTLNHSLSRTLTHQRRTIRTIFHCKVQLRLRVDSTDRRRCTGLIAISWCDALPVVLAPFRTGGWDHSRRPHAHLLRRSLHQFTAFSIVSKWYKLAR